VRRQLDLVQSVGGAVPVRDHAREGLPARPAARRHPVGRERERRAARVVGDEARIAARPALGKLRPVEEERDDEVRPDGPYELGHLVEAREILADQRSDRRPVAQVDHVEGSFADVDCFPPELGRIEGAGEVVLPDLAPVEAPAMVLVLLVAVPPLPVTEAEVEIVAAEAGRRHRLTHTADEDVDVVAGERLLKLGNLAGEDRRLGEENRVDRPALLGGGQEQAVELVGIEARRGHELEEAEAVGLHVRDTRRIGCPEILPAHAQRPRQKKQPVPVPSSRSRDPAAVAHVDGHVGERDVAGERADRDPAIREVRLRDDPEPRRRQPRERSPLLQQVPGPRLERRRRLPPARGRDLRARLVGNRVQRQQRGGELRRLSAPDPLERRVATPRHDRPVAGDQLRQLAAMRMGRPPPARSRRPRLLVPVTAGWPRQAAGRRDDEPVRLGVVEHEIREREDVRGPLDELLPCRPGAERVEVAGNGAPVRLDRRSELNRHRRPDNPPVRGSLHPRNH
jgi:hypothetical protein